MRNFDPAAGEADLFPQEITRVLLNLISNGFYAMARRQGQGGDSTFQSLSEVILFSDRAFVS
jgi:hypothetical protein